MADTTTETLRRTALYPVHVEYGAKLVPFAGYEMPVQFPDGVKEEHLWTRSEAGLFDVSHMGPSFLTLASGTRADPAAHAEIAALIETLVPSDIKGLKPGQARLTVLLNAEGGILDDLIITRPYEEDRQGELYIVVNGAMKDQDWGIFESALAGKAVLTRADDGVLFALQGPKAEKVLSAYFPQCADLKFMESRRFEVHGETFVVSRCGYTGEDGFEVWSRAAAGTELVRLLLDDPCVRPIGLGARDSLRLEAGLCLYGHDLSPEISPVEKIWTGFAFVISFVFFGIAVGAGFQMYAATEPRLMVFWLGVFLFAMIAVGLIKIWFWMRMNHLALLRELKRIELRLVR